MQLDEKQTLAETILSEASLIATALLAGRIIAATALLALTGLARPTPLANQPRLLYRWKRHPSPAGDDDLQAAVAVVPLLATHFGRCTMSGLVRSRSAGPGLECRPSRREGAAGIGTNSLESNFMPRIFDNIDRSLLPALRETLTLAEHADFCVGYFNLRGWKQVHDLIEQWPGGDGHCCRLLVGMQQTPQDELRSAIGVLGGAADIDQATAIALKRKIAQDFRDQLTVGIPTSEDEAGLRRLAAQIAARKVVVKLFLRHPLHAKLYLHFRRIR
jgi:hypothetical protein